LPVGWKSVTTRLEDAIAEEQVKIDAIRTKRQWQAKPMPQAPVAPRPIQPIPEPLPTFNLPPPTLPVSADYTPPQIPQVSADYTPPRLPQMSQTAVTEAPPTVPLAPTKEYELWEKPAEAAEKIMEAVGQGISKVPVLPEVLQSVAPLFEFIHEKLEKPFASIITSPFSPSLSWKSGESWLEHKKREYETWKAPTYVKGLAEFAMPLWWMPWFTWIKGAKALGAGEKLARAMKVGETLNLPTKEVLNAGYKQDWFRSLAHWAEKKPIIGGVVRAVGGESAFTRNVGEVFPAMDIATKRLVVLNSQNVRVPVTDIVKREIVNRAVLQDMRHGYKGLQLPRMQALAPRGDMVKALQVDDFGRVMTATPKEGNNLGRGLSDVFENPELYTYTSKQSENIVKEGNKILTEITDLARKEGIVIKKPTFHRLVEGKEITIGDKTIYEASEYGARFERARHYLTMEEGIAAGVKYTRDPLRSIASTIDYYFKRIATKRFDDEVGKLGMTIPEMVSLIEPDLIEKLAELGTRAGSASYLTQTLKTLKSYRGDSIPGAVRSKIRRGMPDAIEKIEQAFALSPAETTKLIDSLAREIGKVTKLTTKDLRVHMTQFSKTPGRILVREIDDMVRSLNLSNEAANKALRQIYKNAYQLRKQSIDDILKSVRKEADELLKATKAELAPLKAEYRNLAFPYREATGQIFGGLAKFRMHPAFKNRIFDAEVVRIAEVQIGKQGNSWLRNMAQVSGTGRLLVAALDFSAPFLQGLAVLGRNPVAWAKAVGRQYSFFVKPDDFFQYMIQPQVRALATERWAHGGSRSTFEFFEALAPIQRVAEKVPKVGAGLKGAIRETYGRAEVAFSGYGEASRNYMWEALMVKAIQPDGTLNTAVARELARSIDRMTGVMSTEALGIGRGQIDFENAWVFFAPRYTRAGMSYVADMMKGGIAGAEARKGLGSLMAAGMTYYYGVTTALGQKPNLDINSPRFLTVKIGDDYVGVGGILYSLGRLGANVVGTALETPADFLTLSRFDNPFIKFMYSRSSVLTGLTVDAAIEQKNFFGEPLESVGDWGKFIAEKALPIAMQGAILEPEHRNPAVFISELTGLRTFPKSDWELQEETKDSLSQSEYGLSYENLDLLRKRKIDQHPDVTKFQEEIDKRTTQRGKELSVAFLERGRDLDDARFLHKEAVENLQRAYDAGTIDGYDFKEGVKVANYGYGATFQHINKNPRYTAVLAKLEEPGDVNRGYRWELAFDELMEATSGNKFEDEFGIFNFKVYNEFMEGLRLKYGNADFNRAIEYQKEKYAEYPPLFQELQQAKETLKPYWAVQDTVIRLFGQRYADSPAGKSLVAKRKKQMRLTNPAIAQAYDTFYAQNE